MKKYIAFILIISVSSLLSLSLLSRGHVWWDDFAAYIMQAQSLLQHSTHEFAERNAFTISESSYPVGPIAYPWGYPFLLAPILAMFGLKVLALKLVNTLTYSLFLACFYRLTRLTLPKNWSLLLTAVLAFNPALLLSHDYILSDIPFLLFSTLALLMMDRWTSSESYRKLLLIALVIFAAYFIRTNGMLLLAALGVAQFTHFGAFSELLKNWKSVLFPYLIFCTLLLLVYLLLPHGQESYFTHFSMFSLPRFLGNVWYYLKLPLAMFDYITAGVFFYVIILLLFIIGTFAMWRENLHFLVYIALTLLLFMFWPETQGLRFIYPILPLFISIAAQGGLWLSEKYDQPVITKGAFAIWPALAILSLGVSAWSGWINLKNGREINGPFDPISSDMFEFIRDKTPADSVVIFFKPRAMRLFTNRDSFMTDRCTDLSKGDYVVIHEKQGSNGQLTQQQVEACDVPLESVFNNKRFTVYQILP